MKAPVVDTHVVETKEVPPLAVPAGEGEAPAASFDVGERETEARLPSVPDQEETDGRSGTTASVVDPSTDGAFEIYLNVPGMCAR